MKIVKVLLLRPEPLLIDKKLRLIAYQDDVGWYYLKKLVRLEGYQTPFGSIKEIELFTDKKLVIQTEVQIEMDSTIVKRT